MVGFIINIAIVVFHFMWASAGMVSWAFVIPFIALNFIFALFSLTLED